MERPHSPKVSVVIAAYNEEKTIDTTIQGLLGQTYNNHEIVVVDDGSTDETASVVEGFDSEKINLVRLHENKGLPAALNIGIKKSRGEFIARADADEESTPDRLKKQANLLDRNTEIQVVASWYRVIGYRNEEIVDVEIPPNRDFTQQEILKQGPGIAHGSVMMRKSALKDIGGYREKFKLAQDYDLWLRLSERYGENWLEVIPETLYKRKLDSSQLEKRERKRNYVRMARADVNGTNTDDGAKKTSKSNEDFNFSRREKIGMMHYLAGVKLLSQGELRRARIKFLTAIWHAPVRIRPWYKLVVSFLPKKIRTKTIRFVREKF